MWWSEGGTPCRSRLRCRLLISDVLEIQKQILLARISRTKVTDPEDDEDPFKGVGPALFRDA